MRLCLRWQLPTTHHLYEFNVLAVSEYSPGLNYIRWNCEIEKIKLNKIVKWLLQNYCQFNAEEDPVSALETSTLVANKGLIGPTSTAEICCIWPLKATWLFVSWSQYQVRRRTRCLLATVQVIVVLMMSAGWLPVEGRTAASVFFPIVQILFF